MDFQFNSDQASIIDAVDRLVQSFKDKPIDAHGFVLTGKALEQEIEDGGYWDIAQIPELGPLVAAAAVQRLAHSPFTAELALSMLVRPHLPGEWPRPLAVVENGRPGRFVATAKTLIIIDGDRISLAQPATSDVQAVESLYAYPMGKLVGSPALTELSVDDAAIVRKWLRVALAAEASGLIQAAIDSTVEHISVRKQFGRPLAAFQALRHRMAECAVLAGGLRWLALKAAATGSDGDAALAAFQAQEAGTRVSYETHQMLGAMGMTLEHPLHLWTYRIKALLSELGGRGGQAQAVAKACFGDAGH